MQRVVIPERLDEDVGTPQEVAESLADLRRLNRWFGGVRTTADMIRRVARHTDRSRLSLLDIGSGCGGAMLAVQNGLKQDSLLIEPTFLDRKPSHIALGPPHIRRIAADACALPFRHDSFDIVSSTLLAHHLEPIELIAFLGEALRVCRVAVLINDLRRSATSLALVYAGFPLMRSSLSRHDGVASVRRAYTLDEMRAMIACAGVVQSEIRRYYLFRMGAILWKI